jgi:hypothetical protein
LPLDGVVDGRVQFYPMIAAFLAVCKSAGNAFGGSNPPSPTKHRNGSEKFPIRCFFFIFTAI